jgi:RHS repeat-associated protein
MAKQFIAYRYDSVGNRIGMTDPQGGRFTYTYDVMSRMTALQNPQGERTSYVYDAGGRRTGVVNANGTRTSTVYDNLSRVTQVVNQKSDGTVLSSFDYAYDLSGNRKLIVEADGRRTSLTYDAAGQLTGEHRGGTGGYQHTFAYDRSGNRTLKVEDGVRTTFVYDAASQMKYSEAAGGRTTYVYDDNGNQQTIQPPASGRTTYVWDYENRMKNVVFPAGTRNTMTYDPDGLRIRLDESTGSKLFLWDGQKYLATMNASGIIEVVYTNEPTTYGNLVSHREGGQTTHYHFDALGSTRTLTDASQNVLQQYSYGAWGNTLGSPLLLTPFLWVGQVGYHWDQEAQNHYVRARYYRPVIAKWVSIDPLFAFGLDQHSRPQFYVYSTNRPDTLSDPSGLDCKITAQAMLNVLLSRFPGGAPTTDFGRLIDCAVRAGCLASPCQVFVEHCGYVSGQAGYDMAAGRRLFGYEAVYFCYNSRLCTDDYSTWYKVALEEAYHAFTICKAGPPPRYLFGRRFYQEGTFMKKGVEHFNTWLRQHWKDYFGPYDWIGRSVHYDQGRVERNVDCMLRETIAKLCSFHGVHANTVSGAARSSCGITLDDLPNELYHELYRWADANASTECRRIRDECFLDEAVPYGDPFSSH